MIPVSQDPMLAFVHRHFQKYVKDHSRMPSEMKRSVLCHVRSMKMIANLAAEFKKVQELQLKRGRKKIADRTLASAVHDMTETFIKAFEAHCDQTRQSEIARLAEQQKKDDIANMESTLAGKPAGAYEDIDFKIVDDRKDEFLRTD